MVTSDPTAAETWNRTFSSDQRAEQLESDKEAWRGIIGILLAIVTFGVTSAGLVVWAISAWG